MDFNLLGETAAITTSVMWTLCSILFAYAGKRIGALSVNAIRIIIALGFLGGTHILVLGTIIPQANNAQWFYMALSGIIGLALGDFGYFGTLVILGPRRGTLLMSLAAVFAVLSGIFILDEVLGLWKIIGITITLAGVTWVILEREEHSNEQPLTQKEKIWGVLLGVGGAAGQGVGLVVSKYGIVVMAGASDAPLHPLSATLIRILAASIFIWISLIVVGKLSKVLNSFKDKKALGGTFGGAFFGPFIGVTLSMVAVTYAFAGVAQTLMSLMPVMVIPVVWVLYKQKTTWRGILGAIIAICGVAILLLL
ncbi:EamA family transporter [[Eubacterium] cellulosolvens]